MASPPAVVPAGKLARLARLFVGAFVEREFAGLPAKVAKHLRDRA